MRRRKASKKWSAFRNDKRGLLRHRDRQERRIGESIERMVKRETTRALRETCPYCGRPGMTTTAGDLELRNIPPHRLIFHCSDFPACDSFVLCSENGRPLGTIANRPLRKARKETHVWLDMLWDTKRLDRGTVYRMLAESMSLPIEKTHVGLFDLGQCEHASAFARITLKELCQ